MSVAASSDAEERSLTMRLHEDGFAVLPGLLRDDELAGVAASLEARAEGGARALLLAPWCAALARRLQSDPRLAGAIPRTHVPVQCTAFEKSVDRNWRVPVHQDVAIPVAARIDDPALVGWSNKAGTWFVQPPAAVLEQVVALRLHVDDGGIDDGPLKVVAGSHRGGRLDDDRPSRCATRTVP